MENKVSVTNKGVDSAGLTKDYKEAIAEYVWNAFDADSSSVSIEFATNAIDTLETFKIVDNGHGVNYETLDHTFGNFLESVKNSSFQRSSYTHGNKGKGRFSFAAFAGKAIWSTIYKDKESGKLLQYDITITKNKKDVYKDDNKIISSNLLTGTTVTFLDLFDLSAYSLQNEEFKGFLAKEFGWFLYLNKDLDYSLKINNTAIDFYYLVAESEILEFKIQDLDNNINQFKVTYIRWAEKNR